MNYVKSIFFICIYVPSCCMSTQLGIDNCSAKIFASFKKSDGSPFVWGLITNQTGRNSHDVRTVKVLQDHGAQIRAIFAPEHGYHGVIPAGERVDNTRDAQTGIAVLSLYKKNDTTPFINPDILQEIDGFIVDLQDAGMRHYTYISALYQTMEQAAESNKKVLVLDRPNPLGAHTEGPLVDPICKSYISIAPIPVRHGLTIGEFARYCNKYFFNNAVDLIVIPMTEYKRTDGLTHITHPLSPNIASLDSCKGYSFLGLLGEVKPLDVGTNTAVAFSCIALPAELKFSQQQWNAIKQLLQRFGVRSMPYAYTHPVKKQRYVGLRITIDDINTLKSFALLLALLDFFKKAGIKLTFAPLFDKAVGTPLVRAWFDNKITRAHLDARIAKGLQQFTKQANSVLLYEPKLSV